MPDGDIYITDGKGNIQAISSDYTNLEAVARMYTFDHFGFIFQQDAPIVDMDPDEIGGCLETIYNTPLNQSCYLNLLGDFEHNSDATPCLEYDYMNPNAMFLHPGTHNPWSAGRWMWNWNVEFSNPFVLKSLSLFLNAYCQDNTCGSPVSTAGAQAGINIYGASTMQALESETGTLIGSFSISGLTHGGGATGSKYGFPRRLDVYYTGDLILESNESPFRFYGIKHTGWTSQDEHQYNEHGVGLVAVTNVRGIIV